jgi:heme-degrading monooxygenase HmoA
MNTVILINPFEVPAGEEEAALRFWKQAAEYMRRQPGFIATRLHKARSLRGPCLCLSFAHDELLPPLS